MLVACSSSNDDADDVNAFAGPFLDDTGLPVALASLGFTAAIPLSNEFGDVAGSDRFAGSNASALLSGPVFGDGTRSNNELAAPLPFLVESAVDLTLAAALRVEGGVVVVVRNTSDRVHCGAALEGFRLLNANGAELPASRTPSLVDGRVFVSASRGGDGNRETETCLDAHSLGHILVTVSGGSGDVFALAAESASFLLASQDANSVLSPAGVIPVDYTLSTAGGLDIRIVNRLAEPSEVRSAFLLALDAAGLPLMYAFTAIDDFTLAPGGEGVIATEAPLPFTGQASTVRVFVSIRQPG